MFAELRQDWNKLSPAMQTWILGALHAGWRSVAGAGIAWSVVGWKAAILTFLSAFVIGIDLYRKQNPLPREIWTPEQRAQLTQDGQANGASAGGGQ
jgi:hypothetical protein